MPTPRKNWREVHLVKCLPFILMHAGCLLVVWVGFSWTALWIAVALHFVRAFGLTAGYHRLFAHRSYQTSRTFQFILAWIGCSAAQMGPLWWAGHHRPHHRYTDTEKDIHSPVVYGFWWSHLGWFLSDRYSGTYEAGVREFVKFPELRFLNRFHILPPLVLLGALFGVGSYLRTAAPSLGTSGLQLVVWGFFISSVFLYHVTFSINSFAHIIGRRPFQTRDKSRNLFLLALLAMGEGWHNNHHRYPASERQGFFWWQIDLTHYVLKFLSWIGVVWDLKQPPERVLREATQST